MSPWLNESAVTRTATSRRRMRGFIASPCRGVADPKWSCVLWIQVVLLDYLYHTYNISTSAHAASTIEAGYPVNQPPVGRLDVLAGPPYDPLDSPRTAAGTTSSAVHVITLRSPRNRQAHQRAGKAQTDSWLDEHAPLGASRDLCISPPANRDPYLHRPCSKLFGKQLRWGPG
jgi:hypothetical protein